MAISANIAIDIHAIVTEARAIVSEALQGT